MKSDITSSLFERKPWIEILAVNVFYCSIFIAFTFPFVFHLTDSIIGRNDALQFAWNSFNFEQSLIAGNVFFTQTMFHPWGAGTLMHAGGLLTNIIALPFSNKVFVINIILVVHFILSGTGAYRLSRHLGLGTVYALIAGFIFAFSPYKMARLAEHQNLVMTGFVPYFIVFYLRSFDFFKYKFFPKIISYRFLILAAGVGFLQALTDFVVMFHLLYFATFWILFAYIYRYRQQYGTATMVITLLGTSFFLHFLSNSLVQIGANDSGGLWWGGYWADFVRPDSARFYSGSVGEMLRSVFARYNMGIEGQAFVGYSLLLMFAIAVARWSKRQSPLYMSAMLFAIMCILLVSIPEPTGYQSIYSPFAFLHFVPGLTELRCPERIFSLAYLCIAVFGLYQFQTIMSATSKAVQNIALLGFFSVLFLEYYPNPYPITSSVNVPNTVVALRCKPARAVLAYPFGLRDGYRQDGHYEMMHAIYQMQHTKHQLGGYISRLDAGLRQKYLSNDFIRDLIIMQDGTDSLLPAKNYSSYIDELDFESAMILQQDFSAQGAVFLDSVLFANGYTRQSCGDGILLLKHH